MIQEIKKLKTPPLLLFLTGSAYPHLSPVLSDVQAGGGAGGGVVEEHGGINVKHL
ncbi:MAG: hypothetical protein KJ714_05995 [Euryarchaeota archaeon]|nr:hypothetical protein [Euryarchaeota archaeon]